MAPFEAPKNTFGNAPPRISSAEMQKLLLAWFKGTDWPEERPYTRMAGSVAIRFAAKDELHVADRFGNGRTPDDLVLVARRNPPWVAPQSPPTGGAAASHGRAYCRAVVGGYAIAGEGPLLSGEALSKLYRNE